MTDSEQADNPVAAEVAAMLPPKKPRLFIVDGSSYVFRAFYGGSPPLKTKEGVPTGATMVFTNMLLALIRERKPDAIGVAFDPDGPTFRHELYAEYKANRKERPDDLKAQFPWVRQVVDKMSIPVLEVPGYEADDVIATVVVRAKEAGYDVTIVSGDKDLLQLVDETDVRMLDTMGRMDRIFTATEVRERFGGVAPAHVADVLALAGDSSDNVPGVPGVGTKTAAKLVAEFGDLETVLASVDKISGKKRKENLVEFAEQARLSMRLVTLDHDVPISLDLADLTLGEPDLDELLPLLNKLEFHRLTAEFTHRANPIEVMPTDLDYIGGGDEERMTVLKRSELSVVAGLLAEAECASFHLVTSDDDPIVARVVGVAVSWRPRASAYIPVAHRTLMSPEQIPLADVLETLRPWLIDPARPKAVHGDKWHRILLRRSGHRLAGVICDTQLASYLIDPGRRAHAIEALAQEIFEHEAMTQRSVLGSGKKKRRFDQTDVEETEAYACERAELTLAMAMHMRPVLEERELVSLHDTLELPLSGVLADMETIGVSIDENQLVALSAELLETMKTIEQKAFELIGRRVNLNSPKQLSEVLFDELELTPGNKRRTAHGYSTDHASLELIADQHELVEQVIEYRTVSKLRSTYTDNLPKLVNPDSGRIHTRFNQAVAATGRLSSSSPNLQNIPVRTEQGRRIRRAFVPAKGHVFLSADYSQIELRLMAHMSRDPVLLEAFSLGQDVHARTAAEIFEVAVDEVTKAQRGIGKTINFGVLYGMGINRLAREIEVSRQEAKAFLARFDERLARVREFFQELVMSAATSGYAETLLGRRRYIPELRSRRRNLIALGERLAINTPVQGTAADLMKVAMIRVAERMEAERVRSTMLLQVHDELLFEVPKKELPKMARLAREEMEGVMRLSVRLKVDLAAGANWADVEDFELDD